MSGLEDDPYKKAAELGAQVVEPGPDELFIDLDDGTDAHLNLVALAESAGIDLTIERSVASKTPGHYHIYCRVGLDDTPFSRLSPELRIALQACLGSDRRRELLSLARILTKTRRPPTVFFERNNPVGGLIELEPMGGESAMTFEDAHAA